MTDTAKPTPGPYAFFDDSKLESEFLFRKEGLPDVKVSFELAQELVKVTSETGLTPRQLLDRLNFLQQGYAKTQHEIQQVLGKALGNYPWYKDDQKNFPSATDADGVCVGEHVAETIAEEAANVIVQLKEQRDELRDALFALQMAFIKINGCFPLPYSSGHQEMTQAQSALAKSGKVGG